MSARRGVATALVAVLLLVMGFVAGAGGSAWWARDRRAKPWRTLTVEHRGLAGATNRTRVILGYARSPVGAVELVRDPTSKPELARVELRGGAELTVRFDDDGRPTKIEGPDGQASFGYGGSQVRVTFTRDGKPAGSKLLRVPIELRPALKLAGALPRPGAWGGLAWPIAEAWAEEDVQVAVEREVPLDLDIKLAGKPGLGPAEVTASCPPLSCSIGGAEVQAPAQSRVHVAVAGAAKRSTLKGPAGAAALDPFRKLAAKERARANGAMRQVGSVVAAVGVTALACRYLALGWAICVRGFHPETAGAAAFAVASHRGATSGRALEPRAIELYYEDQARAKLDRQTKIQVCVRRRGYARACLDLDGRPFAAAPPRVVKAAVTLRPGLAGTLEGGFAMTQADGPDCKFSPSPRTSGNLLLRYDEKRGVMTATLDANDRGSRPSLGCSLGTGDMRWTQSYTAGASQSFTPSQVQAGGKLPLRLTGTMTGTGSYSWSSCRTSGNVAASCPGGRSEPYSYPIEIVGTLDLDQQTGSGRIVVQNAPLATAGTWQVPKGKR